VHAFPWWVIVTHFLNIVFLSLLARSGIEVLSAFPKLYLHDDCHPGREWLRLTKTVRAADSCEVWSSEEEEEAWPSLLALPGRKNLGLGRHWHLMTVPFWVATGAVYITLVFVSGYWRDLVPTSWSIFPDAVHDVGIYLTFHLPHEWHGHPFNAAQQLSYFLVAFVLAPLQVATGAAMSPAVIGRFPRYAKLFGGRQKARTLHFLGLIAFALFVLIHTFMVVIHGLPHEFAGIVLGSYDANQTLALVIGFAGIAGVIAVNVVVTVYSLRHKRQVQQVLGRLVHPLELTLLRASHRSTQHYKAHEVSAFYRVNGYPPDHESYRALVRDGFRDYRLRVGGLVDDPTEINLDQLRALGFVRQVTKHNCIQGWSATAAWACVPLAALLDHVSPTAEARYVVFHALDDKSHTDPQSRPGYYYGTLPLNVARRPQTILALEMNGHPLPVEHGAPVRLRMETQLGFKMVKWIGAIELVADYADIGQGQGGWREDTQHYETIAAI
jgi:DMSO/TMAO reductase YedYZ molybdopterin-dependent catalytic subunit/thiosulfate reductase cytochrome b subunit